MRLLKTSKANPGEYEFRFEQDYNIHDDKKRLPYAILSHAWEAEEVLYTDVVDRKAETKKGHTKLKGAIAQARSLHCPYLWADTCCIDKRHSGELQEAINSMYLWYSKAAVCVVYLADVAIEDDPLDPTSKFVDSRWFTRGWTLQELVAPNAEDVEFYSKDWDPLGNRRALCEAIYQATRIDIEILTGKHPVESASIAKRMSWASKRETKRPEDWAYCLMGLFSVNMPMLYGEGESKAFLRLQEEVMRISDDHSIFAWFDRSKTTPHGLLADSPAAFAFPEASSIVAYNAWGEQTPYAMTNRGLDIELHLRPIQSEQGVTQDEYIAALNCPDPNTQSGFLAIRMRKLTDEQQQYVRIGCHEGLTVIRERGELASLLVPQRIPKESRETLYPLHIFLVRHLDSKYTIRDTQQAVGFDDSERRLLGAVPEKAFKILKQERKWAVALLLAHSQERRTGESGIVVLLGSMGRLEVGFTLVEAGNLDSVLLEQAKQHFDPKRSGSVVYLPHARQSVRVDMQERAKRGIKAYDVFISIRDSVEGGEGLAAREPWVRAYNEVVEAVPIKVAPEQKRRMNKFYRQIGLRT